MKRFEVHSHTMYSNMRLLDSTNRPEALIQYALESDLSGIAITDHDCLSSHIEVNTLAQELAKENPNFKVALGNEIYLCPNRGSGQRYYHFILIALDAIGHEQLRRLSSRAWMLSFHDKGMERVITTYADIKEIIGANPGHVVATTACLGGELSVQTLELYNSELMENKLGANLAHQHIVNFILWCKEIFNDNFYIECAPAQSEDQLIVNKRLVSIAQAFAVKMVIGTDAHYLKKEDRYVHKSYLNSKGGDREVDAFYEYAYLQTEDEIIHNLLPSMDMETIISLFDNSMEIWEKVQPYSLLHKQTIPKVQVKYYPPSQATLWQNKYPVLYAMLASDDDVERYWVNQCLDALAELNKENDIYLSRLEEEARVKKVISGKLNTNMFLYPVTLQHYVDLFWECGSMVGAGRGSSCSGLNHYLLGITQLDPIEWSLPFWRYLNDEREELGDIDLDLCPSKRPIILQRMKEERGQEYLNIELDILSKRNLGCTLIATFGTESTKSTILTACRGYRSADYPYGIDNDVAQYLSSLVPQERGFLWSLADVYEGNPNKGRKPVASFKHEVDNYPGLLEIMQGIEGLVNKRSSHASGVILFDDNPYKFGCFMKTPKGELITQYDLHKCEAAGMTKYDFLVTDVQDKMVEGIRLLQEYGEIDSTLTLREVYNKYLHPNVLPLEDKRVWKALQNNSVLNVFQFDSDVGSQAAKKVRPTNILELADANGLMRLMTSEPGQMTPMEKYIAYKDNLNLWYDEMRNQYLLTEDEIHTLEPYFKSSYGVPPSQEQLMQMLMDKDICNFTLADANMARKIVGKKQMTKIPALKEQILRQAKSPELGQYVWDCGIGPQMGYSFSIIHALAYSFIGFQTVYLATNWNPIYWNTACLIVNSGALDPDNEKGTDYTKMAKALGDIISHKIQVSLIDINQSSYGFKPDIENNEILFGMKALSNINAETVQLIEANRPYTGIKDFMARVPLKKSAMIMLIKSGAFDKLDKSWASNFGCHPRQAIMAYYLSYACEPKSRLTLQNVNGLLQKQLLPDSLKHEKAVFYFNKHLKAHCKVGKYYVFNNIENEFYSKHYNEEQLEVINGRICILQTLWDNIYKTEMNKIKTHLQQHHDELLQTFNMILFQEAWKKYASGNPSAWEMDSLCFYHGPHELATVNKQKYGLVSFSKDLSPEPEVEKFFKRNGRQIPIYRLFNIIGTVIAKNDTRSSVSILTPDGDVVTVKFTQEYYAMFGKQISEKQEDNKKKVMEKGWFTRGTKILVTGYRRDDMFVAKTYKNTLTHQLYKIVDVDKFGEMTLTHDRYQPQEEL